jgi:predicted TPR repeat methyltransferase
MAEGWYNLGICLRDEGDVDDAITKLRESIARQPDYVRAHEALGMLLYQLGRMQDAAEIYTQWAARDPSNPKAQHMATAASRQNVPSRASDEYIQALFDSSAEKFDTNLEQLKYRAPELVATAFVRCAKSASGAARAIDRVASRPALAVLDAGCGTGLCGSLIRGQCSMLVGVDLSQKMLDRAESRGVYDELELAELSAFMRSRPSTFDAIVCADTLVYFGSLEEPLRSAHEALLPAGWLIFTVESLAASLDGDEDYRLELHGRYVHSEAYLRRVLDIAGFELTALSHETLRQERLQDVHGFLVTARRR